MSDLGDLFDMFSNDDEENKKSRKRTDSQENPSEIDPKSAIINKLTKNKPLLIATVVVGVVIVGGIGFFLFKYISMNGIKGIIDGIKPLLN